MVLTQDEFLEEKYDKIALNTRNHHWVSQFYLKYFAKIKNGEQLYMYQRGRGALLVNIKNVAVARELFTFEKVTGGGKTRVMEAIFSEHEGAVAPVLDQILKNETLPQTAIDRSHVAAFVALSRVRCPSFSDWLRNMDAEYLKLFQQNISDYPDILREEFKKAGITFASDKEFEDVKNFIQDPEKSQITMEGGEAHYFSQAMELGKEFYNILMTQKSWHLLIAPQKRHFITSDNPVVIQELHNCPSHLAGGFLNGTVLLTISPKLCLAFRRISLKNEKIQLNREDVNHINESITKAARRQIYSHIDSKDITSLCNKYLIEVGAESKLTTMRLAKFAPYYITRGMDQLKEVDTLKNLDK